MNIVVSEKLQYCRGPEVKIRTMHIDGFYIRKLDEHMALSCIDCKLLSSHRTDPSQS